MRVKLREFGDDCEGIRLEGNPKRPEPDHVRIAFPGGDVDVARTTEGSYWVHIRVNRKDSTTYDPTAETAVIADARLDQLGKHPIDSDLGDFDSPDLYHVAVLITK